MRSQSFLEAAAQRFRPRRRWLRACERCDSCGDASRRRAFDRFWRQGSDGGGSGLGLAIVRKLVEADGGSVELGAAASGGLDVLIRLPAASAGPAPRSGT